MENDWEGAGRGINEEGSVLHLGGRKSGVRGEHPAQQRVRDLGQSLPGCLEYLASNIQLDPVSQSRSILLLDELGEIRETELLGQVQQQLEVEVSWDRQYATP